MVSCCEGIVNWLTDGAGVSGADWVVDIHLAVGIAADG